jgi:uncharacterized protein DUF3795
MDLNNIAYCGLYCAECPNKTGVIADKARDLRKELRTYRFEKTAELLAEFPYFNEYKNYKTCYEVLGAMVKMRCYKTCREGGANPGCKIRKCAKKNTYAGCWECTKFENCEKLDFLNTNHGKAHIKNLRKLNKKGIEEFLSGEKYWYVKN